LVIDPPAAAFEIMPLANDGGSDDDARRSSCH
jgi:hypothetical protein